MPKLPKMPKRNLVLAAAATLMLGACANSTPYAPAANGGDGYSQQKLETDKYRIVFSGNSLTDRVTVENYVLYRAAEVTVQSGNDYFIMLDDSEDVRSTFRSYGTTFGGFGGNGFGRRGFFYGGGFGNRFGGGFGNRFGGGGFGTTTATTRQRNEYTIGAIIQVYKGNKPVNNPTAYDARSVIDSLGPSIIRAAG